MREYQSTRSILEKALQQAGATHVKKIYLAIGEVSELDQDVIQQQWAELSQGTALEHVQLNFRLITAEAQCMACFKKYHPVNGTIHCPHCGSYGAKILSGEEFYVEKIETDNE